MKLTSKEIIEIFALYYGAQTQAVIQPQDNLATQVSEGMEVSDFYLKLMHDSIEAGLLKHLLKLRRLSSMTPNDVLQLSRYAAPAVFNHVPTEAWSVKKSDKWDQHDKYFEVKAENSLMFFRIDALSGEVIVFNTNEQEVLSYIQHHYWQWYFRNKFAIKLFPWNKDPFELGIAVPFE